MAKVIFLIKYKIKEFKKSKNLIGPKDSTVWFKDSLVITSGGATVGLGPKGKTARDPNKKKGILGTPDNKKKYV